MIKRLPTRLDRYPAKMVSRLADQLVARYATNAHRLLDPFCGSGAVLVAGQRNGVPVSGIDINPIAAIYSQVKLQGFSARGALEIADDLVRNARRRRGGLLVRWPKKHYWFTPATLEKFERLRSASVDLALDQSKDGLAVLLSFALSVRLCSRADQRSPKPFISKQATAARKGRHFDPYKIIPNLLDELSTIYDGRSLTGDSKFLLADITTNKSVPKLIGKHSHVITSPPYINAQDYFRNFKLELHLLEGVLPFQVDKLTDRFIGTERGDLLAGVSADQIKRHRDRVPELKLLAKTSARAEAIVHRYLYDMGNAFDIIKGCLESTGTFVLVCGDNLIAGQRIRTWKILTEMLMERGFKLFDHFTDPIGDRLLAPKRCGHKGLIKEEVISAFRLT